jgi:hypothetical protein
MFGAIYTPGLLSGQWPDGNHFLTPFAFVHKFKSQLTTLLARKETNSCTEDYLHPLCCLRC